MTTTSVTAKFGEHRCYLVRKLNWQVDNRDSGAPYARARDRAKEDIMNEWWDSLTPEQQDRHRARHARNRDAQRAMLAQHSATFHATPMEVAQSH